MILESISHEQTAMKLSMTWAGQGHAFLVASVRSPANAGQAAGEAYGRTAEMLRDHGLEIIHERIFGSLSVEPSVMAARHRAFQTYGFTIDNPVTYIQGTPPWGEGFAGMIIHAVSQKREGDVWTIIDGDRHCGRGWRKNGLTYLILQNIQALDGEELTPLILSMPKGRSEEWLSSLPLSKPLQIRQMLDRAERILRENGASYRDVVRTWFYLSDILDWYAAFNKVRNEKYGESGIMPGPGDKDLLLPASTGISGDMSSGASSAMDLIAIVGEVGAHPAVTQLTNAAQLDAFRYGAAFSRGAVIREDDVTLIQISGTAAIDEHGMSLYPGDIRSQINCTLDKIEKLISKEGAGLKDIAAATVFLKNREHASVFWEMAKDRGLEEFPAVCIVADVCRDELLFEIDGEAVVRT